MIDETLHAFRAYPPFTYIGESDRVQAEQGYVIRTTLCALD